MASLGSLDNEMSGVRNRYFVVRHAQAESNVQKKIVSNPAIGSHSYKLTDIGKEQAQQAGENLKTTLPSSCGEAIVVSSVFKRAEQTANIIRGVLGSTQPLQKNGALNERNFGQHDLKDSSFICETREKDVQDDAEDYCTKNGIENVTSVLSRMSGFIQQLEATYTNKIIILVSHGDPLRILLAGFANIDPRRYASIRRFDNAEIRVLTDPVVLEN